MGNEQVRQDPLKYDDDVSFNGFHFSSLPAGHSRNVRDVGAGKIERTRLNLYAQEYIVSVPSAGTISFAARDGTKDAQIYRAGFRFWVVLVDGEVKCQFKMIFLCVSS